MSPTVHCNLGNLFAVGGLVCMSAFGVDVAFYRALDFKHPICDQRVTLNAAGETFVEIANNIPGVDAYNDLVRAYRAHTWEAFDRKRDVFRKVHESSPLLEPVSYLNAQASFERAEPTDAESVKNAERRLRETLVLYPRSELAPIVSGSMAEFWIRGSRHANALALYQSLRTQYPKHPLNCLFTVGAGESAYLLGDREGAESALKDAVKTCSDPRLKLAAEIRLADLLFETDSGLAETAYDKILKTSSPRVEALHPAVFHNLGELRYRGGKFESAAYQFNRFLELRKEHDVCAAQAVKRTADMEYRNGTNLNRVVGIYQSVLETSPGTDIGRFSRLHAFLVTLPAQGESERARRLRIIDEDIDKVVDLKMREALYVEKGLAWLEAGEFHAVTYLSKIRQTQEGELGRLVKQEVSGLLEKMVATQGADALSALESSFVPWVKNSPTEKKLGSRYEGLVVKGFTERVQAGDRGGALRLLERWRQSPYWSAVPFSPDASDRIAGAILGDLFATNVTDERDRENRATEYLKQRDVWAPLFKTRNGATLAALAAAVGDTDGVAAGLGKTETRSLASLPKQEPLRELTLLARAAGARRLGDNKEAEKLLRQIKSKKFGPAAAESLLGLYEETHRSKEALDLAFRSLASAPREAKAERAQRALQILVGGKLWTSGPKLVAEVAKLKLPAAEHAPYLFLAGRSAFEKKDCAAAVTSYEKGLQSISAGEPAAEARYRLGKCLVRLHRNSQARKVWQDLVQMEDSFWSPLAQNDLKLIH